MRLASLTVESHRCYQKPAAVPLSGITAIAGQNDTGKTTFLTAACAALTLLSGKPPTNMQWLLDHVGVRPAPANRPSNPLPGRVMVDVCLEPADVDRVIERWAEAAPLFPETPEVLGIKDFFSANCLPLQITLSALQPGQQTNSPVPDIPRFLNRALLKQRLEEWLRGRGPNCSPDTAAKVIAVIEASLKDDSLKIRVTPTIIPALRVSLQRHGSEMDHNRAMEVELSEDPSQVLSFVQAITNDQERYARDYRRMLGLVQQLFPDIHGLAVRTATSPQRDIFLSRQDELEVALTHCGSGIANLLYVVGRILAFPEEPAVIFFDEPETDLHPALQRRLVDLCRSLTVQYPHVQWVLATHSPFILSSLAEHDHLTTMLQEAGQDGRSTVVRNISVDQVSDAYAALGVYLPDLFGAKAVVCVEGPGDRVFYRGALLHDGMKPVDLKDVVFLPVGGSLLRQVEPGELKRLHPNVLVVLDSDKTSAEDDQSEKVLQNLQYARACAAAGLPCFIDPDHRTLENLFPPAAVAAALKAPACAALPELGPFASEKEIDAAWRNVTEQTVKLHRPHIAERVVAKLSSGETYALPAVAWLRQNLKAISIDGASL